MRPTDVRGRFALLSYMGPAEHWRREDAALQHVDGGGEISERIVIRSSTPSEFVSDRGLNTWKIERGGVQPTEVIRVPRCPPSI
jgi:hypothetical protein